MNSKTKDKKTFKSTLMLSITSIIWGFAFVAQASALDFIGVHTFNAIRFLIGAFVLFIFITVADKKKKVKFERKDATPLFISGGICGVILAIANFFQMSGLKYTSVGKAGFITVLYIIIVPLWGVFTKKKIKPVIWISVLFALIGSFLLFIHEGFVVNIGDLSVLVSSFLFAAHILVVERYTDKVDSIKMAFVQFFVCGMISFVAMLMFDSPDIKSIGNALVPILYSGILSTGVGYSFQFVAQRDLSAPVAGLIMSMESVFAAIAGWLILNQSLSSKEIIGCALIFCGIILVSMEPVFSRARNI